MAKLEAGFTTYLTQHYAGNGRGLSTGKLLPPNWRMVKVTIKQSGKAKVVLIIEPVEPVVKYDALS